MPERPNRRMELDEALSAVGEFGPYQYLMFACLFLVTAFHGARMTSSYYFLYDQEHSCYMPPNATIASQYHDQSLSFLTVSNGSPPAEDNSCYIYNTTYNVTSFTSNSGEITNDDDYDDKNLIPCPNGWTYNKSIMKWTATAQYNLVCDKKLYVSHGKTALFLGSLLGGIVFGKISDRYGRKVSFHISLIMMIGFGIGTPFSSNFLAFVITYGLSAAASTGLFAVSLVTAMEYVLPKDRKFPGLLINVLFPIGEMILTGVAFGLRDWRWISITITAPSILLLSYYWIIPESIRWLMTNKKYNKLDQILRRVARINGRPLPYQVLEDDGDDDNEGFAELLQSYSENEGEVVQRIMTRDSFFHLFKHCVLASRVGIISYNWLIVNLAYYGLVAYSTDLGQGLFLNFLLGAVVEAPAHVLSFLMVDRIGRKKIHCFYFLLVIVATGTSVVVCFEVAGLKWILLLMTMVGKFGAAGLTGTSFLWMTELYPTSVRSTGLGVGSGFARIGAIISSYVIDFGEHIGTTFGKALLYIVICAASALAFILCLLLPETSHRDLPSTIEEARHFGRNEERELLRWETNQGQNGAVPYVSLQDR